MNKNEVSKEKKKTSKKSCYVELNWTGNRRTQLNPQFFLKKNSKIERKSALFLIQLPALASHVRKLSPFFLWTVLKLSFLSQRKVKKLSSCVSARMVIYRWNQKQPFLYIFSRRFWSRFSWFVNASPRSLENWHKKFLFCLKNESSGSLVILCCLKVGIFGS